jgi:hypothetical protein
MSETPGLKTTALDLITAEEAEGLTALVMRDNPEITDPEFALGCVDEALKFVATAAKHPANPKLRPSRWADAGWHALILTTVTYLKLGRKLGRFVHHVPEGPSTPRREEVTILESMQFIREAGYQPVDDKWLTPEGLSCHTECNVECNSCVNPGVISGGDLLAV